MGSGVDEHDECAAPLGELIAALGANLLTGGGQGVMRAVSRAFTSYRGERGACIGIIPCASVEDRRALKAGYPNEFVEIAIRTHLPYSGPLGAHDLSRNHINILSSDAIVALPGGEGTASEVALALRYRTPVIMYSLAGSAEATVAASVQCVEDIRDVERFLRSVL
jgi:uncharacterized protein (TIGR00725 family)